MNARQKAKKYKKELDRLKYMNNPRKHISNAEVFTNEVQTILLRKEICGPFPPDAVTTEILRELVRSKDFLNCVDIHDEYDPMYMRTILTARVKLIKKNR